LIRVVGYLPESWDHRVKIPTIALAERHQTELAYHPNWNL